MSEYGVGSFKGQKTNAKTNAYKKLISLSHFKVSKEILKSRYIFFRSKNIP